MFLAKDSNNILFASIGSVGLLAYILVGITIFHLVTRQASMRTLYKVLWIVFLILFSLITVIIYWILWLLKAKK